MIKQLRFAAIWFFVALIFCASGNNIAKGQVATGGNFTIEQSVVASGGGQNASGGSFALDGTIGQTTAGMTSTNPPFSASGGFWSPPPLAPTAAMAFVSGRIITAAGRGIRNVRVSITLPSGEVRNASSGPFGYYRFDDLEVGHIYILSVAAKRFTFANPTRVISLDNELTEEDFIADGVGFFQQDF